MMNVMSWRTTIGLAVVLSAFCTFAEPVKVGTKSEVVAAKSVIDDLVASGADAEKLVSMAVETEKGSERFWLYSNAFILQTKEGKYAEATETLKALQQNVTDIPEVNIVNLIEKNVGKKIAEAPELAAMLKESRIRLSAQKLVTKFKQGLRKSPRNDTLKVLLGEALAASGDWDAALKAFSETRDKVSAIAKAEQGKKATMRIAAFWWDYQTCRELSSSKAFKAHAVGIYEELLKGDQLSVIEKTLAESRIAKFSEEEQTQKVGGAPKVDETAKTSGTDQSDKPPADEINEPTEAHDERAREQKQCREEGRPRRPNGLDDVDRKNLPKLWSAPGVKEHVLKRSDGGDDIVFVECPPGNFVMGFREEKGNAFSRHRVTLTYPFWMQKTQLTWGQFYLPGVSERGKGSRHGCHSFSCEQMAAYLHCLNEKCASQIPKGYVIRFPTFAEYQYAYRANSKDPTDPYTHNAFVGDERKRICHDNNTRKGWNGNCRTWPRVWPAEVGLLEPNAWGLYDMCGNGFTYLCDRVNPNLSEATHFSFVGNETDPIIYEENAGRVLMRGGDNPDWLHKDFFCPWRWAFTCRLVVGPDFERKGRENMIAESLPRHDACFREMAGQLARRKHGPQASLGRNTVALFPGCSMEFVQCPPGSFTMGHEAGNGPFRRREVTISRSFYMATERMTVEAWFKYLKATGRVVPEEQRIAARKRGGERCALCGLSDEDWNGFLQWLNDRHASEFKGYVFRLPTEAEWEYAYRAGASRQDDPFAWTVPFAGRQAVASVPFSYTEDERRLDFLKFGHGNVAETSWDAYTMDWQRKALVAPGQVGTKKGNAWGLKDMIGNGREWVLDRFCCAAGKFPAETYACQPKETDPLFGYELVKWDCQMCRGGDDGYAGRKCWDDNGSDWNEDVWYPTQLFCYRLVIGPDLIREKREKAM